MKRVEVLLDSVVYTNAGAERNAYVKGDVFEVGDPEAEELVKSGAVRLAADAKPVGAKLPPPIDIDTDLPKRGGKADAKGG